MLARSRLFYEEYKWLSTSITHCLVTILCAFAVWLSNALSMKLAWKLAYLSHVKILRFVWTPGSGFLEQFCPMLFGSKTVNQLLLRHSFLLITVAIDHSALNGFSLFSMYQVLTIFRNEVNKDCHSKLMAISPETIVHMQCTWSSSFCRRLYHLIFHVHRNRL